MRWRSEECMCGVRSVWGEECMRRGVYGVGSVWGGECMG